MATLYELGRELEPGQKIAWVGEKSVDDVESVYPKTVAEIERGDDSLRVEAKGIRGGEYYFTVDSAGDSEAFFVDPGEDQPVSMGPVVFAELSDTDDSVSVKRGYFDDR